MTALENLSTATSRLAGSVDKIVVALGGTIKDADVQAQADIVNAQTDRLDAALAPTPPPAPPAPPA